MFRCDGHDPNGIPRVYGHAETEREALTQCQAAVLSYMAGRPDTQPYDKWTFHRAEQAQ